MVVFPIPFKCLATWQPNQVFPSSVTAARIDRFFQFRVNFAENMRNDLWPSESNFLIKLGAGSFIHPDYGEYYSSKMWVCEIDDNDPEISFQMIFTGPDPDFKSVSGLLVGNFDESGPVVPV